ncbi:hydroxymethylglutaryl-CoA reductase [candidate division WOR-3 bacterium]|nr:hydroxymethylglutaryl-CoA reductase [candidate division WOR-3 bacterium]
MAVTYKISQEIIKKIIKGKSIKEIIKQLGPKSPKMKPLPQSFPREATWGKEDQERRLDTLKNLGYNIDYISGKKIIDNPEIYRGNIENYIGSAIIPMGIIGPLRINGVNANGDFFIPMATTEGALIASYNRGAKAVSLSGGVTTMCLTERVSRAPAFLFNSIVEIGLFIIWAVDHFGKFKSIAESTTKYGKLEDMQITIEGNNVYFHFEYTTGDASGQNMVTFATDAICKYIVEHSSVKPKKWYIESNLSGDKKATQTSYLFVRGKKVTSEATINREYCRKLLHCTPEEITDYARISTIGAIQSGSIGAQGQYANGLTAIYAATGQDIATVAEASIGITRMETTKEGNLYIAITLPNLIVGTIGGGTSLPTQREALDIMGCAGEGNAKKFAEICTAVILAGELSVTSAIASGEFSSAHKSYGRKN